MTEEKRTAFIDDVRGSIAGLAVAVVDVAALAKGVAIPPVAAVAKESVKFGFNKVVGALKRWF